MQKREGKGDFLKIIILIPPTSSSFKNILFSAVSHADTPPPPRQLFNYASVG